MPLAEPTAASLPLPGGSEGATVRLHPFITGEVRFPRAFVYRESGRLAGLHAYGIGVRKDAWLRLPIPAYLVEHPTAGAFLIDTGLHPSVAVDPRKNFGLLARFLRGLKTEPEQPLPARLRAMGIDPKSIGLVVMTHLHNDHASAISEFPGATFLMSAQEWEVANQPRGLLRGYVKRHFDHGFDYRTLDFESEEADSFATFGRSFDVFGDGAVRLVHTPGHTLGHLSLVLRLKGREALITADAAYTMGTLRGEGLPGFVQDEHLFRRSLRELQIYAKGTPDAVIFPGHDAEHAESLLPVYE